MKKYHFVYKTTNKINGKIYIGKHSTNNINDGYLGLGSGSLISKAINKYENHNFNREIIKMFNTSEEACLFEQELLTKDFVDRLDVYNISSGSVGVIPGTKIWHHNNHPKGMLGKQHTDATKAKIGASVRGPLNGNYGKHLSDETKHKISNTKTGISVHSEEFKKERKLKYTGNGNPFYGKTHSDETKKKLSKSVLIDGIEYKSIKAAAASIDVKYTTIHHRLNSKTYDTYMYVTL